MGATCGNKQGWSTDNGAFFLLANNALGDIAHGVDCANHFMLADDDIVQQAFELRRRFRVNKRWIGLFENTEQRQAGFGGDDVLSLSNQERLFFQSADDFGSGCRCTDAFDLL